MSKEGQRPIIPFIPFLRETPPRVFSYHLRNTHAPRAVLGEQIPLIPDLSDHRGQTSAVTVPLFSGETPRMSPTNSELDGTERGASRLSTLFNDRVPMEPVALTDEQIDQIVLTANLIGKSKKQAPFSLLPRRSTKRMLTALLCETDSVSPRMKKRLQRVRSSLGNEERTREPLATVEKRKAVVDAVRKTKELGKPYEKFLHALLDGDTSNDIHALQETIPPWQETVKILSDEQLVAAEAASMSMLLKECEENAKRRLLDLRQEDNGQVSDKGLIAIHIAHLFEVMSGKRQETDGYYEQQARSIGEKLSNGRNQIFDSAQYWGESDQQAMIRGVVRGYKKVFKEGIMDTELSADIGLTSEMVKEAKRKGKIEWSIASLSTAGQEAVSHVTGIILTAYSMQDHLPIHNQGAMWLTAGISYAILGGLLVRNGFLNKDLLKMGLSTDIYSKSRYINAIGSGNEDWEGLKAYGKWHGFLEVLYFIAAGVTAAKYGIEPALFLFTSSNMAGVVKNGIQLGGGRGFLKGKELWDEKKEDRKLKKEKKRESSQACKDPELETAGEMSTAL